MPTSGDVNKLGSERPGRSVVADGCDADRELPEFAPRSFRGHGVTDEQNELAGVKELFQLDAVGEGADGDQLKVGWPDVPDAEVRPEISMRSEVVGSGCLGSRAPKGSRPRQLLWPTRAASTSSTGAPRLRKVGPRMSQPWSKPSRATAGSCSESVGGHHAYRSSVVAGMVT